MKTCEKCGVELRETSVGYFMGVLIRAVEVETNAEHTPERCRDRLAARLAEATEALEDAHHVLGNCEDHQVFAAKCARCIIEKALGYT